MNPTSDRISKHLMAIHPQEQDPPDAQGYTGRVTYFTEEQNGMKGPYLDFGGGGDLLTKNSFDTFSVCGLSSENFVLI
jgi:hypothetical protein